MSKYENAMKLDERNVEIRTKMKKNFTWFDAHGDEDNHYLIA